MKRLRKFYPLILVLLIAVLFVLQKNSTAPADESFRSIEKIAYTKHARCRMGCRFIEEKEIREIIENGIVNKEKSGYDETYKDETFVLEGYSYQNQHIRVVLTPRNNELLVITVIDLDKNWACDCS